MANYGEAKREEHLRRMRKLMTKKPNIGLSEVVEYFKNNPSPVDGKFEITSRNYARKLMNRVQSERANNLEKDAVKRALGGFKDEIDEIKFRLWKIVKSPKSDQSEKIRALREIRRSSEALFDKLFDAGIFEKKLGTLNLEEGDEVKEHREEIINAFENFGVMLEDGEKIEKKINNEIQDKTKDEIRAYAKRIFDVDIKTYKRKDEMIKELKEIAKEQGLPDN